jgi:hypothetical protein
LKAASLYTKKNHSRNVGKVFCVNNISKQVFQSSLCESCVNTSPVHSNTSIYTVYAKSCSNWYCSAYKDHIFYNKRYATNVYATNTCWRHLKIPKDHATNVMRQIFADAIWKFQKITRQMLCDKCSKNDVTPIPKNANVLWREKCWRHMAGKISLYGGY